MADDDLAIWLQALDGQWELCGSDRLRGIQPQDFQAAANRRGSDTCRFVLRRDPGGIHPDLSAFTPCDAWIAGQLCWTGEVKETPTEDGDDAKVTVEGQGAQYDLDVDQYERAYVHTRMADWKDGRSHIDADLTVLKSLWSVATEGGIKISTPQGQATAGSAMVYFDAGPDSTIARITWTYAMVAWAANQSFNVLTADTFAGLFSPVDSTTRSMAGAGTFNDSWTLPTPRRFIAIRVDASAHTPAADEWVKLTTIKLFRSTAYESGNASVLKADTVIKDALDTATVRTSRDYSQIQAGTFSIPDLVLDGAKTPGEVADAVNAYEGYVWMLDVNRRPIFRPKPTAPLFEVGNWSGADFKDASANSGENIFNKVRVEAEGPDGSKQRAVRWQPGGEDQSLGQLANPSADVDIANWTAGSLGVVSRDTTTFDSSPACIKLTPGGSPLATAISATVAQPLKAGRRYMLRFAAKTDAANHSGTVSVVNGGNTATYAAGIISSPSWAVYEIGWVQPVDTPNYAVYLSEVYAGTTLWVDTFKTLQLIPTLADRRSFAKSKTLPVGAAMSVGGMQRIGDIWLADHRTTPLKGDVEIVGQGGVRRVLGGQAVHPAHLLRYPNELLRLSHRIDPDTGGQGRDGTIAAVQYDHDSRKSAVSLDDERGNAEKLLARYAAVVGTG